MRYRALIMVALILGGCALALGGCGKSGRDTSEQSTSGKKVLRAAVSPTSPPNCFRSGKDYVGIDVEIFRVFSESQGLSFEMTAYDWAGMLGAVQASRADVAFSGISITDERKKVMNFSDAYMVNTLVIAALADHGVEMATTADWKKYRLGSVRGMYFSDLIKTKYRDAYAYANLKQYPSYKELLAALSKGKVDGAFMDSLVMADQKEKGVYDLTAAFTLEESDQFGFAFPKGSALRDQLNDFLRDRPEEIQAIVARHVK